MVSNFNINSTISHLTLESNLKISKHKVGVNYRHHHQTTVIVDSKRQRARRGRELPTATVANMNNLRPQNQEDQQETIALRFKPSMTTTATTIPTATTSVTSSRLRDSTNEARLVRVSKHLTSSQRIAKALDNHKHIIRMPLTSHLTARSLSALCLILFVATTAIAENLSSNSGSATNNYHAQQDQQGAVSAMPATGSTVAASASDALDMSASNGNYQMAEQQQMHGTHQPSKSKKIQIVYIKVPLAKLRHSLGGQQVDSYASANSNSSAHVATGDKNNQEQYEQTTEFKSQGSQQQQQQQSFDSSDQQQVDVANDSQQQSADSSHQESTRRRKQPQSFLIPMALVQTSSNDQPQHYLNGVEGEQSDELISNELPRQPFADINQQQSNRLSIGHAGSQLHAMHAQPWSGYRGSPHQFFAEPQLMSGVDSINQVHSNRIRSPAMQAHHLIRQQQQQQLQQLASHQFSSPPQGFMSSFLLGEKEKMTMAAMRLQQQQANLSLQQAATASPPQLITVGPSRQMSANQLVAASSNTNEQSPTSSSVSPATSPSSINPKGPGGLMPSMIAPLSRMPDNAIGQAYGAAVGIALPSESGSPSSLLSSPSTSNYGKQQQLHPDQQQQQQQHGSTNSYNNNNNNRNQTLNNKENYLGGNSGTNGEGAYSSGIGSSTLHGTSGQSQHAAGSSEMAYQGSPKHFAATAPSSGYGNGANILGASAAFSDYPAGPLAGNNQYNHQSNQQAPQLMNHQQLGSSSSAHQTGADDYNNAHLKQAKKTIIPIVVQVEHAILENAQAANQAASAYQQQQQQQQPQQVRDGNKYSGGRSHRQLGGGKRSRHNSKGQANRLYGAATNEVAHYGDIPPGAQWVNAANAYDINQITAQINAENAASAAAALAQADMAFGPGAAAAYAPPSHQSMQMHQNPSGGRPTHMNQAASSYAAGLQSAASALLANTHPVIQAAASGGLASVSKLGAKFGEMIAMPPIQMPGSIANSLPSAISSLTNQMGAQLGQAVQQVAKEHPAASAFARQVAQQAGVRLPNFGQQHQQAGPHYNQQQQQQQQAAASNQYISQMSPQAQLQKLKLGIGQSLQTAASSLVGLNQKANEALTQQPSSLLSGANGAALNMALRQLGAISPAAAHLGKLVSGGQQMAAASTQQQTAVAAPPQLMNNEQQQQISNVLNQFLQKQQQIYSQLASLQQGELSSDSTKQAEASLEPSSKPAKSGSSSFKSKFLSFFQPPKFISNLINWNDRADDRNDRVELSDIESSLIEALEAASKNATTMITTSIGTTQSASGNSTDLSGSRSTPSLTSAASSVGTTISAASKSTGDMSTSTTVSQQTSSSGPTTSTSTTNTTKAEATSSAATSTTSKMASQPAKVQSTPAPQVSS